VASAAAVVFPSSARRGSRGGRRAPPAGGDRAAGATCELSAGGSRWADRSSPAERETRGNVRMLCRQGWINQRAYRAHELRGPLGLSLRA